tara:strand:+ start:2879 stop:3055 length:177 start_codon:yes stop_codon:yes gene_type:complete
MFKSEFLEVRNYEIQKENAQITNCKFQILSKCGIPAKNDQPLKSNFHIKSTELQFEKI